jgi:hypothetical protein
MKIKRKSGSHGAAKVRAANAAHFDKAAADKANRLKARNAYRSAIGLPPAT